MKRILTTILKHFFSVPEALKLYEELGVKHQPLKIITPKFEAPLPPLQAAVRKILFETHIIQSLYFACV